MRLRSLVARGFRNLADLDFELPPEGVALLGANGQGKTNLLEALYYPVLCRSFRGASDQEIGCFGGPGFHVEVQLAPEGGQPERRTEPEPEVRSEPKRRPEVHLSVGATYLAAQRRKRITVGAEEIPRVADAVGLCLAVAFLPVDVGLATGPAADRRRYLDRLLSLAEKPYLLALSRYRAALAQRNSALRQHRPELAHAFDGVLADAGAVIVDRRLAWLERAGAQFAAELACLGEGLPVTLRYRGRRELADRAAWDEALAAAAARDRARGVTTLGPHRDDLVLELAGRPLREVGSTGQQRTAAVALKLLELDTLCEARSTEPALLLDDVFAELDRDRQERLARRLAAAPGRQVFVTAPRRDELPPGMALPIWEVERGRVKR
ncbi:MAG TPA: DNA replication and repair protein RecF [Gemmatimonadales bacterium]|nr:DNA replication and repair protein RecF [Gemmatimonadales bacterium]